jgi:hypothetical protein
VVSYPGLADAERALSSFRRSIMPNAGDAETTETGPARFASAGRYEQFVVVVLDAATAVAADDLRRTTMDRLTPLAP